MTLPKALELAGEVSAALDERGTRSLVIGAIALAAHGYVRGTEDVDLAIAVDPKELEALGAALQRRIPGTAVSIEMPTVDDPLGGVIDLRQAGSGDAALVQIVNFDNAPAGGFPALVREARSEPFQFPGGTTGSLASIEDLVFFKLYAGGTRSRADVEELLVRRQVDLTRLWALAERYRMQGELRAVLGETTP